MPGRDVRDKRSVSPHCSTPFATPMHRLDARLPTRSAPLIISRLIEIGNGLFDSPLLRIRFQPVSVPFCRSSTTMTSKWIEPGRWRIWKKVENERKREEIFCSFFFDDCRDREKNFFSRVVRWRIMEIGMDGFPRRDT